ncbi:MAG TPA: hypothetical protein PKL31_03835 [Fulvivirga sp.]|nr:hypothetical protein [Fulvivirga sp.]
MKNTLKNILVAFNIFMFCTFSSCDNETVQHPCNFPDSETYANLREPFSFKILDSKQLTNIVDTTGIEKIHPDSVLLFTSDWIEINPKPRLRFDGEWIFDNFPPYINVPINDPQSLLDLDEQTFYLRTSSNDIDTILVNYQNCLVIEVEFNKKSTSKPSGIPSSAGFYFLKNL